jgi:hypothetical protein
LHLHFAIMRFNADHNAVTAPLFYG